MLASVFGVATAALAGSDGQPLLIDPNVSAQQDIQFKNTAGFADTDENTISQTIANVIRTVVGFVGVIFVILMVWGGLLWMTSAGNDERVGKAKKMIAAGIIGLVIVLSAYAITALVLATLFTSAVTIEF